jgi:hypothetical protein
MYENQIGLKFIDALGFKATVVENVYTTISNNEADKTVIRVIRVDAGRAKGESTSIAFFKGNGFTNIQLGATNNADQASIIKGIIDSIKINN